MTDLSLTNVGNLNQSNLTNAERLKRAAAQFEAQFLNILMKDSKEFFKDESEDALFGESPALGQFKDLLHNALVERSAGGAGIAQMLVDSLDPDGASQPAPAATPIDPGKAESDD